MNRICIFAEFSLSVINGKFNGRGAGQAATWLPQLAKAWEKAPNLDVHWGIFDRTSRRSETKRFWNQTFHTIPCPSTTESLLLCRWPHRLAVRKFLRKMQPDLIHSWGTENLYGVSLLEFDGPSVLSMQGIITPYFRTGDLKGWRWELLRHWERLSIRKATVITCESQWGIGQVKAMQPSKSVRRIEYGVFDSFYDVDWSPQRESPRILYVGGMNRLKGVDILVEILKRNLRLPWTMVFAGEGYLLKSIQELNHPSVEVLGMLKTEDVQLQMQQAWALVVPSRADTSPNVVKEARVIGLPVIGSPHGGHAEYIESGKDGFIVKDEDPDTWYSALRAISSDYDQCRIMGEHRHKWFRDYFRPEGTAENFMKLYFELLHK